MWRGWSGGFISLMRYRAREIEEEEENESLK